MVHVEEEVVNPLRHFSQTAHRKWNDTENKFINYVALVLL